MFLLDFLFLKLNYSFQVLNSLYERYNEVKAMYSPELLALAQVRSNPDLGSVDCEWYGNKDTWNSFMVLDIDTTPGDKLYEMFDAEWSNKRPVLVKSLHKRLSQTLWRPQAFLEEFGDVSVHLINCRTHKVVPDVELKYFWYGFEDEEGK